MAGIENILPSLCKSTYTNYKYLKKGLSTLGQQVSHSVKNTYKSMSCQSADNIVGSSGFTQQQEAYNNATDDSVRHNLEYKTMPLQKFNLNLEDI